jgi:predicted Zn-dependent peptidase
MITLDRKSAPAFKQVEKVELIRANPVILDNGIKAFVINAGEQEILRIEFVFENVNWNISRPLQAYASNCLLIEGTNKFTSAEIAERVDFYGAFLQTDYNYDLSTITLYTLSKHLAATLPIMKEIITDAVFPQDELNTFVRNQKQKLCVNLEKNDFLSRRAFNKALFGSTIYGYSTEPEDYDRLTREELLSFHHAAYQPANCTVVISGKITDDNISYLNDQFGKAWSDPTPITKNKFQFNQGIGEVHFIEKKDALQSALRMGQISINRTHPDFPALQVLNTVLGGYFGSRLMANIREEKGYTYGIGSAIVSFKNAGYFFIASEVGAEVCQSAMTEIEKEINLLRKELIPIEELKLVSNYMLGSMLGGLENAFSHADKFKNIYFSGLDYTYYDHYINTVKTITPEKLIELANSYFDFESMEKVIVGKM